MVYGWNWRKIILGRAIIKKYTYPPSKYPSCNKGICAIRENSKNKILNHSINSKIKCTSNTEININ